LFIISSLLIFIKLDASLTKSKNIYICDLSNEETPNDPVYCSIKSYEFVFKTKIDINNANIASVIDALSKNSHCEVNYLKVVVY
jgi:hypothetical protein